MVMISKNEIGKLQKTLLIMLLDFLSVSVSFFVGLWIRFDFSIAGIPQNFMDGYLLMIPFWCIISVAVFRLFDLYNSIWAFVSISEAFRVIGAYIVLAFVALAGYGIWGSIIPRSSFIIGFVFSFLCTFFNRKCGHVYVGALTVAALACWIVCGGSAML